MVGNIKDGRYSRKLIIAGGTGALGSILIEQYLDTDTEVVVLTRAARPDHHNIRYVQWDARTLGTWVKELEGATAVVNLVGKSVNCRYTEANKAEIVRSRVDATAAIGKAIQQATAPPQVWINAGSAAIFGNAGPSIKTEESVDFGEGFSPDVCKQWEVAFQDAPTPLTRKVILRIGVVLQTGEGVLKPFVRLARFGLGGPIGSGEQYLSWLHGTDFARLVEWVIEREQLEGVLHACSPYPVKNRDFMRAIRKEIGVPFGLPNPAWSTKIGAYLIGTESELVLSGRRVVSRILEKEKFEFRFPEIVVAFRNLAL